MKENKKIEFKESITINSNLLESEITDNFSFKSLMQQQSGPVNPIFEGIDVMQL
jgi:hypothetical protein